jgi:glycosyltransferase involved in cell wall biosynthesis
MTRLRLLYVVPFVPRADSRHGGRVIPQLLRRFVGAHEVAVAYLAPHGAEPMDADLAARCALVEGVMLRPEWRTQVWHRRVEVFTTPLTGRPSAVSALYSRRFAQTVRRLASGFRPDVIQIEHDTLGYCAPVAAGLARATLLVCHDPGLQMSSDLARVTQGRQRLAHQLDVLAWRRFWRRNLPPLDATVAFTRHDAEVLRANVPGLDPVVIPLGIDAPAAPLSATGTAEPSVAFVAGYSHPPNADAALRLIGSIMPEVRRTVPGARLLLVGDRPTRQMRAQAGAHDTITGRVEDVGPYVDAASLVALPIRLGGGMRVKLLEALAAGKAVVASPVAAAGLELADGEQLVLADTDEQFATAIARLLGDPGARVRLGAAAREWALANLSWEDRARRYEQLYRRLLGGAVG